MERSRSLRIGPSGGIRGLAAQFQTFAFTRHAHEHYLIGLIAAGLQTRGCSDGRVISPSVSRASAPRGT